MSKHLWQQTITMITKYSQAILATCGVCEPQASMVPYQILGTNLHLFVPHTSDHLFNLERRPDLVLLSSEWKLHGHGYIEPEKVVLPPHSWQVVVRVKPVRFHILGVDGTSYTETIDFEDTEIE